MEMNINSLCVFIHSIFNTSIGEVGKEALLETAKETDTNVRMGKCLRAIIVS